MLVEAEFSRRSRLNERSALVIGIGGYGASPLVNPIRDAEQVASALKKRGFEVTLLTDVSGVEIDVALNVFSGSVKNKNIALIYLAGHAIEKHGSGYFLPIDFPFPITPGGAHQYGISLNDFVEATADAEARIIILDACRNWPADLNDSLRLSDTLDTLASGEREWHNVLMAFSTSASTTASDGVAGSGSSFCNNFCQYLLDQTINVDECFRRTSVGVVKETGQQPWTYSSLKQQLSFRDLPQFSVIQRHVIPKATRSVAAWCIVNRNSTGIFAGLSNKAVWHANLAGLSQISYGGDANLIAAADLADRLILIGQEGELFYPNSRQEPFANLETDPSFGVGISPTRNTFTLYGEGNVTVLRIKDGRLSELAYLVTDFDIYCCEYISENLFWVGGENGNIFEIDVSVTPPAIKSVIILSSHVNAMSVSQNANIVFCVDMRGKLTAVDRHTHDYKVMLERGPPKTAAGIRAALLDVATDELIRHYIFHPENINEEQIEKIEQNLEDSALTSCSVAPNLPLIAVGTSESTLLLIDIRDNQIVQEINILTNFADSIPNVVFLSDTELVTISNDGLVTFMASA